MKRSFFSKTVTLSPVEDLWEWALFYLMITSKVIMQVLACAALIKYLLGAE